MNAPEPPAGPSDPKSADPARSAEHVRAEHVRYVDRREIFAQHAFFRGLAAHAIDDLVARSRIERCRRGKTIFRRASPGTAMMAVLRGTVKICTVSRGGKEAVLNVIGPGQVFGEIAVLDGGPRTADAVALVDSDILVLDRRDFLPVMRAHPELAQRLLEVLCGRLRKTSEQLEDAFFLDMPGRLAKALLGAQTPGPGGAMQVMLTQREIGEMIGTARESVNKLLHTWERAGIVSLRRGAIAVKKPEALKALAEGESGEG